MSRFRLSRLVGLTALALAAGAARIVVAAVPAAAATTIYAVTRRHGPCRAADP